MSKPYCYDCMQSTGGVCSIHSRSWIIKINDTTNEIKMQEIYLPEGNYRIVCGKLYRVIHEPDQHNTTEQQGE